MPQVLRIAWIGQACSELGLPEQTTPVLEHLFGVVESLFRIPAQRPTKECRQFIPQIGIEPPDFECHFVIDKRRIQLEEPIKSLGIYTVPIRLHAEVTAEVKVWVVKE